MIGIGADTVVGIKKESSFGAGGTPVDTYLELISENVKDTIEKIPAPYVFGSRNIHKYFHGAHDIGGPFSIVVNPDNIGLLLFLALGVEGNATQVLGEVAEVTEITCGADTSGSLSGEYILLSSKTVDYYAWFDVDDAGSADPAVSGRTGIVVGITENDANTVVATALAAAINALGAFGASAASEVVTITNAVDGAATDATIGDTGWAAANITQQGSGGAAYDHIFTPAGPTVDLGHFAMEIDRGIDCSVYTGMTIDTFTLTATKGSLLTADFATFGKQEADGQSPTGGLTPSSRLPYTFQMGSVKIVDTAVYWVNSFTLTYVNALDAEGGFVLGASSYRNHLNKTTGLLTGTLDCEWTSASDEMRDHYIDNTPKRIQLILTSTELIEAGYYYTLSIDIPITYIMGEPPAVGSRERIPFTVNFEATYDGTNYWKVTHRDARTTKWSA